MEFIITQHNAAETMKKLLMAEWYLEGNLNGWSHKIRHLQNVSHMVDTLLDRTVEAGFCTSVYQDTFDTVCVELKTSYPELKQAFDEDYKVDLSSFQEGEGVIEHYATLGEEEWEKPPKRELTPQEKEENMRLMREEIDQAHIDMEEAEAYYAEGITEDELPF
ncbi:hypothetical protein IMZ31_19115 (plasmid) [Pontibacillus sp. ALD_SL1]|uniref:hypothetical protein n=1 Tax=Pontibacillus sp. ALD_SL1 TaxID=2777185 RepID=UPI001A957795|nr:hypothetical protein [Pontibacillus sp. ALD_SL1]QST02661.1 hypothetical protein IMZ31_19115 [Pontibacillus sp. ALD_SL1]